MYIVRRKTVMHRLLCELRVHFVNGIVICHFISCVLTWLGVDIVDLKWLLEMECNWYVVSICEVLGASYCLILVEGLLLICLQHLLSCRCVLLLLFHSFAKPYCSVNAQNIRRIWKNLWWRRTMTTSSLLLVNWFHLCTVHIVTIRSFCNTCQILQFINYWLLDLARMCN